MKSILLAANASIISICLVAVAQAQPVHVNIKLHTDDFEVSDVKDADLDGGWVTCEAYSKYGHEIFLSNTFSARFRMLGPVPAVENSTVTAWITALRKLTQTEIGTWGCSVEPVIYEDASDHKIYRTSRNSAKSDTVQLSINHDHDAKLIEIPWPIASETAH